MERHGFIHDMMDVKILILYVAARVEYPVTTQEIYELCYQDDCLSYFDVCTAVPQLVESGHLETLEDGCYKITRKGREDCELTAETVAFSVRQRAENAVVRFNRQLRRSSFVKTKIVPRDNGEYSVVMILDDEVSNLMTMELVAPDQRQALRLSKLFEKRAEIIYNLTMTELLNEDDD